MKKSRNKNLLLNYEENAHVIFLNLAWERSQQCLLRQLQNLAVTLSEERSVSKKQYVSLMTVGM